MTASSRRPRSPRRAVSSRHGSRFATGAVVSFARFVAQLPGQAGLAVAPLGDGPIVKLGTLQAGQAWSTMKVVVLATLLGDLEQSGRTLTVADGANATLAVEQSDNAAAEALFGELERLHGGLAGASDAVQETLRQAGDETTTINTAPNSYGFTTWGQSTWSTTGEIQFYRALAHGCLLNSQNTAYVLTLMRNVVPSERWGAGSAGYPVDTAVAFKGGWGPEVQSGGGYMVRQTAIIRAGSGGYVMSMIALPANGLFSQGTGMITALATWARQHVEIDSSGTASSCGSAS